LVWRSSNTDEIRRHPEVETLLVTRDNRTEIMRKVLGRLTERVNWGSRSLPLNTTLFRYYRTDTGTSVVLGVIPEARKLELPPKFYSSLYLMVISPF
jgi:hypothetical protein